MKCFPEVTETEEFAKKSEGEGLILNIQNASAKSRDSLKKSSEEMVSVAE